MEYAVNFNIKTVLDKLDMELNELTDTVLRAVSIIEKADSTEDAINAAKILASGVVQIDKNWKYYTKTYKVAIEKDIKKEREAREAAEKECAEYKEKLLNAQVKIRSLTESCRLEEKLNTMLNLVYNNIGAISTSEKIRTEPHNRKGEQSHRFNHSVDTMDLIKDYTESNNRITEEMCKKYKLSHPGIKNRLINAGVYKGRKK